MENINELENDETTYLIVEYLYTKTITSTDWEQNNQNYIYNIMFNEHNISDFANIRYKVLDNGTNVAVTHAIDNKNNVILSSNQPVKLWVAITGTK